MIKLKTLHNSTIVINADLIERIENVPETMITLTNGKKVMVAESADEIIEKVIHYKGRILKISGAAEEVV
ncbi:MAG: flagellar protein FlbD [Clostridia bacterium]|jgi:flagellar protein FlbD|nr:flagellar FlbD family protein [Clostridiales bacterium]MDK2985137.1 flagellar protein FlbD [Clostridia bacterium]